MKVLFLLLISALLNGCVLTATTSEAQCAGRAPIIYNSKNPASKYYAAPMVASQIAVTNQTGVNLRCKSFL